MLGDIVKGIGTSITTSTADILGAGLDSFTSALGGEKKPELGDKQKLKSFDEDESPTKILQRIFTEVQTIAEKYKSPLTASSNTKEVSARFKTVRRAQRNLIKLQARVLDYPFYTEAQRHELSTSIEGLALSLNDCSSLLIFYPKPN